MDFFTMGLEPVSSPDIVKLLQSRYFLSHETEWEDIAKRVSVIFPDIFPYIKEQFFCPSTPTLLNLNTNGERVGTFSSCFIMGIEDSVEGIFEAAKECAIVTKASGGVGYVFNLRGRNEIIKSLKRQSSGPLPFLKVFNNILDGVSQGGVRRGAGMAQLDINHPDILYFIDAKKNYQTEHGYDRFNLSVRVPDWFYEKIDNSPNEVMMVKNVTDGEEHPLLDNGKPVSVLELWNKIIFNSHQSAEPGLFNETIAINRSSLTNISKIVLGNPCNEFISIPYTSCNLGSINLIKFVKTHRTDTGVNIPYFDFTEFEKVVRLCTIYLNKIIDNNKYPLPKIEKMTRATRPIGLGVMGLAHTYYLLGLPYSSEEAKNLLKNIIHSLTFTSMEKSIELAKEDGAYEAFDLDLFLKANERFWTCERGEKIRNDIKKYGIRNHGVTSIAPTGSISYLYNCSSGIEPVFALSYTRKIEKINKQYDEVIVADRFFDRYLDTHYKYDKNKILKNVSENNGSCQNCGILSNKEKAVFTTAQDLKPMEHLDSLAIVSNNVSFSVSKTINLPRSATVNDIGEVYRNAHKMGCIGVTVYREGSREGILIPSSSNSSSENKIVKTNAPKRPKELNAEIFSASYKGKKLYVAIGFFNGDPYEVFVGPDDKSEVSFAKGKIFKQSRGKYIFIYENNKEFFLSNGHSDDNADAIARLVSASLRHGCSLQFLIHQLEKAKGDMQSFSKVVARILKKFIKDGEVVSGEECPDCKSKLIRENGCKKCLCGWSACN